MSESTTEQVQVRDDVPVKDKRAWLLANGGEHLVGARGKLSAAAEQAYAERNPKE